MPMRECGWCGERFRVEYANSPALYCKRGHKTAAEQWRKKIREEGGACSCPDVPGDPIRGRAAIEARRLGRLFFPCMCGVFHVMPEGWEPPAGRRHDRVR